MTKWGGVSKGFLGRLLRNQAGNIIVMTAAAVLPMIGLVGGAVDMGRLYAVKSRLQSACDAGALAGRRVMGSGQWADHSDRANSIAIRTFDLNFEDGRFGTTGRTRAFTEVDGTVTGNASVEVPMTLMKVFGMTEKDVAVTCEGQMRIPNTDVMFVLDNSGSMNEVIPGDTTGLTKMVGLRRAIRCFYEALARINITDVSPTDCGTTEDPSGGLSSQTQLRFGFVNYDNMVNVGKLLPHDFIADNWTYQSREPVWETAHAWTTGTESTPDYSNWSATPSYLSRFAEYGPFSVLNASWGSYVKKAAVADAAACNALNQFGSEDEILGIAETYATPANPTYTPTDNDPPVWPNSASQNLTANQNRSVTVKGYRYGWVKYSGVDGCWLQVATKTNANVTFKYTQNRTGPASRAVNWMDVQRVSGWTYKPVSFDISGLKGSGTSWNATVALPIGQGLSTTSYKLSGSNVSAKVPIVTNTAANWGGCIEERQTFKNVDGDPSNDWLSYPSSPSDAFDMDIDRTPQVGNNATQWRPVLHNAVWGRQETLTFDGSNWSWGGNKTINAVTASVPANNSTKLPPTNAASNSCLTTSRLLTNYNGRDGNPDATNFSNYVNTIVPHGNTYHDIGLLWGARLMSPTGIFASDNATTPGGAQIARHMIFMTDGATANTYNNYASYGLEWWDQRQVDPAGLINNDYETKLEANNNARSNALCTAIKNRNITLWVISYGNGVDVTTQARLRSCATSPSFFFSAANTPALIAKFREIANKISNLRLTQ
nr:G7 [uncultured bacterium]